MHILEVTLLAIVVLVGPSVLLCGLLWLLDHLQSRVGRAAVAVAVLSTFAALYALPAGLVALPS